MLPPSHRGVEPRRCWSGLTLFGRNAKSGLELIIRVCHNCGGPGFNPPPYPPPNFPYLPSPQFFPIFFRVTPPQIPILSTPTPPPISPPPRPFFAKSIVRYGTGALWESSCSYGTRSPNELQWLDSEAEARRVLPVDVFYITVTS